MKQIALIDEMAIAECNEMRQKKNSGKPVVLPEFRPGDTVVVSVRVVEGEKERIQKFKGVVIARRGKGISETFRVRKISNGVGVERVFPLHSPIIQDVEVFGKGNVRQAKLYYLRGMTEKQMRQKIK